SGTWLSASPLTGSTSASSPGVVTASVNPANLAPGFYQGTVTLQLQGSNPVDVQVFLTVDNPLFCLDFFGNCQPFSNPVVFTAVAGSGQQSTSQYLFDSN